MSLKRVGLLGLVLVVMCGAQSLQAALSANILTNGTFESTSNIKVDNLGGGKRPWQFSNNYTPEEQTALGRANDLGYWVGDYSGISMWDDPRARFAQSTVKLGQGDVNTPNISVGNGGHMLETVGFRSSVIQVVAAPANQTTGSASISFDYFWKAWTDNYTQGPTRFRVQVYGLSALPTMIDTSWLDNDNAAGGVTGETLLWSSPFWDTEWPDWVDPVWHITTPPNPPAWQNYSANFNMTQTYPYYYIRYHGVTYHESHSYFWAEGGIPTDTFALGWDSVSLQLPVVAALRGDVNLDGLINALDISPFVSRLTSGTYQTEADINQDNLVNALDISGFVTCLVNGACAGEAGGATVPEPASLGMLLLAAGLVLHRR